MKKKISLGTQGRRADIGEYKIKHILPNRYFDAVGPFVFLDHHMPAKHLPDEPIKVVNGSGAHPHRGIAALTYILNGEADLFDSNTHALQFWINLPSKQKAESPDYLALQPSEVPKKILDNEIGWLKVIAGDYENIVSKIPGYSRQFLYHVHINKGKTFSVDTNPELEYAAFLPLNDAAVNDIKCKRGELLLFSSRPGSIEITSTSEIPVDIIVFGGEPYSEPTIAHGRFEMETVKEIAMA